MKIQLKQPDLARILAVAGGAAMAGGTTLPILHHVHIAINPEAGTVRMTGTNLERWSEATALLESQSALEFEEAENGEVIATASAKQFTALVSSLPSSSMVDIEFETRGLTRRDLTIQAAGTKSKLPGMAWEEYPLPPDVEPTACLTIPAADLIALVDHVAPCVSKDQTRPILTGVHFDIGDGKVKSVGTDQHRLGIRSVAVPGITGSIQVVIPAAPLLSFMNVVRKAPKDTDIQMEFATGQARLTLGDTKYTIRLLEGQYPNYHRVVPTGCDREIIADRQEVTDAVSRALIAAAENANRIVMDTDHEAAPGMLHVSGESSVVGEIASQIDMNRVGDHIQIAFNGIYLKQAIAVLEAAEGVRIRMSEPLRPCIVTASGEGAADCGDALTVVMPMQVI